MPLGAHITLGLVGPEVSPPARHLSLPFLEANSTRRRGPRGRYPRTMVRYDRRSEEAMREAVRALHVPYRRAGSVAR